jgi:non-heme chloroperoxidase
MPFFQTKDQTSLYYSDWGKGQAIVFLSSISLSSTMWGSHMIALAKEGLRCIAYDRRGHGRSDDSGQGYDFDTMADDLATLIDKLDLRQVVLVGHSMACGEIIRYLSRHGSSRVSRIILASPNTPCLLKAADNPEGFGPAMLEGLYHAIQLDYPKWLRDIALPYFGPNVSADSVDQMKIISALCSIAAVTGCNQANFTADFRKELTRIDIPSLIIHGDADVFSPIHLTGQKTAALIKDSRMIVYEGAPHGIFLSHKEKLIADILADVRGAG